MWRSPSQRRITSKRSRKARTRNTHCVLEGMSCAAVDSRNVSPFSERTRELREHDIAFFERALLESRTTGPKDLKKHLPRLLWMYQMGIILFWIYDSSRVQEKSELLLTKSLDMVVRLIKLSSLPLTGPIRRSVVQLMDTLLREPLVRSENLRSRNGVEAGDDEELRADR